MDECDTFDLKCQAMGMIDSVLTSIGNQMSVFGYSLLKQAFSGGAGTITNDEWSVATAMTSRWGLVLLVVVVGLTIVQMGIAVVQGRPQQAASSFIVGVCTWPITIFSVWLAVKLTDATDRLSVGILNSGDKAGGGVIGKLLTVTPPDLTLDGSGGNSTAVQFHGFVIAVMALGAVLGSLMLSFMLAFRNFAILVLIGFAPVAFMCLPLGVSRAVTVRWCQLLVSLILAKPLAAGILVMANELLVTSSNDLWQWIVALAAMALAAFAPVITMRLFSFAGGESAGAMGSHGASVVTNTGAGAARGAQSVAKVL